MAKVMYGRQLLLRVTELRSEAADLIRWTAMIAKRSAREGPPVASEF